VLATAVALALPMTAVAQLEEVVVTATKRTESIQDIPMSIEAVSGDRLSATGITEFEALSETMPNFSVGDSLVTNNIIMRGMGSGSDRSFEQSVSMFIDGIYMPRSRQYRAPFLDVERVEIVRGPQAVLFGLNSMAGAVSVLTARSRPGDAFTADVTAEYETEYSGTTLTGVVGGSVGETLGLRIAAQTTDSGDGYFENTFTGKDEGAKEQDLVRLTAVWEPTELLTVSAKGEYVDFETDGNIGESVAQAGSAVPGDDGKLNWVRAMDASLLPLIGLEEGTESTVKNFALNIDYALGEHTLTAAFGYSDFEYQLTTDLDGTPLPVLDAQSVEEYEQTSIDIRLTSPGGETFDYIVGAYYHDADLFSDQPNILSLAALAGPAFGGLYEVGSTGLEQNAELWSVYASGTWNITDTFRLIGGVRYADEEKEVTRPTTCDLLVAEDAPLAPAFGGPGYIVGGGDLTGGNICAAVRDFEGDRQSDNWMPEIVAQWDTTDNITLFAKVGTSAKSGGFATAGSALVIPYDDEEVIGYEFGMKSQLWDGLAELNITLFRNEFTDLQVNSFLANPDTGLPQALITNAGESTSQGIEADARWAATDWLTLGGSLAYLDAEYDKFKNGPCSVTKINQGETVPCDLAGERLPFAAEYSGNLSADVDFPLGSSMRMFGGVNVSFSDDYFTEGNLEENVKQDSWTKVSARIGVGAADDRWSLSLIGNNLTDEKVLSGAQSPLLFSDLGYLGAPRTLTVQAVYRFGS
jgi:outer membrane receptor protein involved in Fe transport